MSLLKFFKKKEQRVQVKMQQANATLYPDQILIGTEDKTVVGYSIVTPTVTRLPIDATAESIGRTVRRHLSLSKTDVPAPTDFKAMYKDFLHAAGFKNAKAHNKGARYLIIYKKDQAISITPTINGGAIGKERGFWESKDLPSTEVNVFISDKELGKQIKEAWQRCVDNSA